MIDPSAVVARVRELPALSTSVLRVQALVRDPRSCAADLEQAIRPDPALTANVLRIANSAYFGLRCRAGSVRHAVALLGMKRLSEIAAAAALAPIIPSRLAGYEMIAAEFWRHSVAVAVFAERIAAALSFQATDGLFTAALLHDVGKLAIASYVEGAAPEILARTRHGAALVDAERAALGVQHAEVGAAVAEAWHLSPAAAATARWHHAPRAAGDTPHRRAIDIVHLADGLAHVLGLGADVAELARSIDPDVEDAVGLDRQALERIAAGSVDEISELAASLAPAGASA